SPCCCFVLVRRLQPSSPLFPYTTLFRSTRLGGGIGGKALGPHAPCDGGEIDDRAEAEFLHVWVHCLCAEELRTQIDGEVPVPVRSEEHTSELQSRENLVCRLLLEKKKKS